jgi:hypothetical protein
LNFVYSLDGTTIGKQRECVGPRFFVAMSENA